MPGGIMYYTSLKQFYNSKAWKDCRDSYIPTVHGLCEECLMHGRVRPGFILHHKTRLTLANVNDPSISLNHECLKYLCIDHHNAVYAKEQSVTAEGLTFDANGNLVKL
jgi:5-methylcytosine-specific restriction protein A